MPEKSDKGLTKSLKIYSQNKDPTLPPVKANVYFDKNWKLVDYDGLRMESACLNRFCKDTDMIYTVVLQKWSFFSYLESKKKGKIGLKIDELEILKFEKKKEGFVLKSNLFLKDQYVEKLIQIRFKNFKADMTTKVHSELQSNEDKLHTSKHDDYKNENQHQKNEKSEKNFENLMEKEKNDSDYKCLNKGMANTDISFIELVQAEVFNSLVHNDIGVFQGKLDLKKIQKIEKEGKLKTPQTITKSGMITKFKKQKTVKLGVFSNFHENVNPCLHKIPVINAEILVWIQEGRTVWSQMNFFKDIYKKLKIQNMNYEKIE